MRFEDRLKIISFVLLIIISLEVLYLATSTNSSITIKLQNSGFYPAEIKINKDDVVKFISSRNKPFWPASDIHPTHSIYPDFDSQKPISPTQSWEFKFDRVGSWKYHDHLSPSFRGTIVVVDSKTDHSKDYDKNLKNKCQNLKDNISKTQCWNNLFDITLEREGLEASFKLLDNLFQEEPNFASDCHGFAHKLGEKAYHHFLGNISFNLSDKTAYCGYGFYHGFMETLLKSSGDIKQASKFCKYVKSQLPQSLADACLHGIGHGAIQADDQRLWGNEQAIIDSALQICHQVAGDATQLSRCASGVFMELGTLYTGNKYKLILNPKDPLKICRQQSLEVKLDCYTQMNGAINWLTKGDLSQGAKYVEQIPEDRLATEAIETLTATAVNIKNSAFNGYISICRNLQPRLHLFCIKGLALAFMLRGSPDQEYKQASQFCNLSILTDSEKRACFDLVIKFAHDSYEAEKMTQVCSEIDQTYRGADCK